MLLYLTLIFACQLVGELIVKGFGLAIPGPVVGMALLFTGLLIKGGIPKDLGKVGDFLISHLSLLFIPAGVGILLHANLIRDEIVPLSVSLLVSTLLTIAVTAGLMQFLTRSKRETGAKGEKA